MHFDNCRTNPTLKYSTLVTGMKEFIYLRDSFTSVPLKMGRY